MASDVKFEFSPRSYNTNPVANDDEKRNQRRNKLFRRIQMDIKVTLQIIKLYNDLASELIFKSQWSQSVL